MDAHIYGKRTWYNLWHSFYMIKKLIVSSFLLMSNKLANKSNPLTTSVAVLSETA